MKKIFIAALSFFASISCFTNAHANAADASFFATETVTVANPPGAAVALLLPGITNANGGSIGNAGFARPLAIETPITPPGGNWGLTETVSGSVWANPVGAAWSSATAIGTIQLLNANAAAVVFVLNITDNWQVTASTQNLLPLFNTFAFASVNMGVFETIGGITQQIDAGAAAAVASQNGFLATASGNENLFVNVIVGAGQQAIITLDPVGTSDAPEPASIALLAAIQSILVISTNQSVVEY